MTKPCAACGERKSPGSGLRYCDQCRGLCPVHGNPGPRSHTKGPLEYCPHCRAAYMRAYLTRSPEAAQKNRDRAAIKAYDITETQLAELRSATECAACGDKVELVIDHDHKTGQIRGMLCSPCNLALGMAKDNVQRLRGLIQYLEKECY